MKSLFNRSFALVLALSFFVSTTGIVLASHRCLANAHQTISLYTNSGCCEEKDDSCNEPARDSEELSSVCCVTEFSFHKIVVTYIIPDFSLHHAEFVSPELPQFSFNLPVNTGLQYFSDHSPPLLQGGKTLLISIHRLLV